MLLLLLFLLLLLLLLFLQYLGLCREAILTLEGNIAPIFMRKMSEIKLKPQQNDGIKLVGISCIVFPVQFSRLATSLSFRNKRKKEKGNKGKRKKERRKDRLLTLVHPIEATFKFFCPPDSILDGE